MWGPWEIPPGDTATVAIISVDRDEAAKRLVNIEAILAVVGVSFEKKLQAQEIHIGERRAAFAVKTCSLTGTVGFTSIAIFADEQAKWISKEGSANPAGAVMATLRPTMATQPLAFEIDCSAPWEDDDYHASLCKSGTTEAQEYDHAATWEAHPALTKERTRADEPDETEWLRAYAAIPPAASKGGWFGQAVESCSTCDEEILSWVRYMLAIEISFATEHLSFAVVSSRSLNGQRRTRLHRSGKWDLSGMRPKEIAERLLEAVCKPYAIRSGYMDQEEQSFADHARAVGISLQIIPWTTGNAETSEVERYRSVRASMRSGTVELASDDAAITDLRAVRSRITPAGNELIDLPRARKGGTVCRVPAIVLGISEALRSSAQPEPIPVTPQSEAEKLRAQVVKEIVDRRRKEWQRNQTGFMRRAMGLR